MDNIAIMTDAEILERVGAEWTLIYLNEGTDGPEVIIGYYECPHCKQRREKQWVYEIPGIDSDSLLELWDARVEECWPCRQKLRSAPQLSSGLTTGREPALPRLWAQKSTEEDVSWLPF